MLQQTQVKTVMPYWERWMTALPTITALARARPDSLHKLWEGLGYYTRVRNLQRAAHIIVLEHRGVFPDRYEQVLSLPGIGAYTAGAICSIAFHQPHPILDGNVARVLARLFSINRDPRKATTRSRLWRLAAELVRIAGGKSCSQFNQALMELGALVCTPRQPACEKCPVRKFCAALKQGRVHLLPTIGRRPASVSRRFAAFVVEKDNRFLVRQRPAGVVNAHLWEFPNAELFGSDGLGRAAAQALGAPPRRLEHLCQIKHSITRYRITLDAYRTGIAKPHVNSPHGDWLTPAQLLKRPFTSAHKRILNILAVVNPRPHARSSFSVNLYGAFLVSQAAVRHRVEQGQGGKRSS